MEDAKKRQTMKVGMQTQKMSQEYWLPESYSWLSLIDYEVASKRQELSDNQPAQEAFRSLFDKIEGEISQLKEDIGMLEKGINNHYGA